MVVWLQVFQVGIGVFVAILLQAVADLGFWKGGFWCTRGRAKCVRKFLDHAHFIEVSIGSAMQVGQYYSFQLLAA